MNRRLAATLAAAAAAAAILAATGPARAGGHHPSEAQMIACRDAVHWGGHGFNKLPVAAFSVYPARPKADGNVRWSVNWHGTEARGLCAVTKSGRVKRVTVNWTNKDGKRTKKSHGGYYYDRHKGVWRDPDGDICWTCTPENGFYDHGEHDRSWRRHQDRLARKMQRILRHELTAEDIRELRRLERR